MRIRTLTWFHTVWWWWHSQLWWGHWPDSIQYGDGGTAGYEEDTDLIPYSMVMVAQPAMRRTMTWFPYSMVMVAQPAMRRTLPSFHTVWWWWHSRLWGGHWPHSIQYGDGGTVGFDEDTDLIPYSMVMVVQPAMMRTLTWFHTVWWWWHSRLWGGHWPHSTQYGDGGTAGYDGDTHLIPYSTVMVAQPAMMRILTWFHTARWWWHSRLWWWHSGSTRCTGTRQVEIRDSVCSTWRYQVYLCQNREENIYHRAQRIIDSYWNGICRNLSVLLLRPLHMWRNLACCPYSERECFGIEYISIYRRS